MADSYDLKLLVKAVLTNFQVGDYPPARHFGQPNP
jgi:hypothetical protein